MSGDPSSNHGSTRASRRRVYVSTYIWLSLVLTVLCLLNLPGRRGDTVWEVGELSHGWPLTFVLREVGWEEANPWAIAADVAEFSFFSLLADLAVAGLALWGTFRWSQRRAAACLPNQPSWLGMIPWRLFWMPLVMGLLYAGWSMEQRRLDRLDTWEAAAWSRIASRGADDMGLIVFLALAALGLCLACLRWFRRPPPRADAVRLSTLRKLTLALTIALASWSWALWRAQASQRALPSMAVDLVCFVVLLAILAVGVRSWRSWRERNPRRQKLQFGLRTLLIAPVICGVPLAYAVDYHRQGKCLWGLPQELESFLVPHALRPLAYVANLCVSDRPFHLWNRSWWGMVAADAPRTAEEVNSLRYMIRAYPQQTSLCLSDPLTDEQITRLPDVNHVRSLIVLEGDDRNDSLLPTFTNVRHLFFKQSEPRLLARRVPYDFLGRLRQMSQIRKLYVFGEHVDDDELAHLRGMPDLEELHITWSPHTYWLWGTAAYWPVPEYVYPVHDGRPRTTVEAPITDRGLAHLGDMRKLVRLRLEGTEITGPGLASLHALPRLRHLSLERGLLTDAGLTHVNGCTQLVSLDLTGTQVVTLEALDWDRLKHLKRLDLTATDVSEQRLDQLRRQHPGVQILHKFYDDVHAADRKPRLSSCSAYGRVNPEMLQRVSRTASVHWLSLSCSDVEDDELRHLAGMTQLTYLGLAHLQNLTQLRELNLSNTPVTDLGPLAALTGLRQIWLERSQINSEGLQALAEMAELDCLDLTNTPVTDPGLSHLARLGKLTDLRLSGTQVSDAGLVHLAGLFELRQLHLHRTKVTGAGLTSLGGLMQLQSLSLDSEIVDNGAAAQLGAWVKWPSICLHHPQKEIAQQAAHKLRLSLPGVDIYGVSREE